jgi:DNA-directed RNA polymerase alpha subunit
MQKDNNKFDFTVNVNTSIANAIRRTIISSIPTNVIDTVCIKENDSILCDEMIAHRLGQIPLRVVQQESQEPNNQYTVKLKKVGPKRIYSRDLEFSSGIEPVSPDIIILNLGSNECIDLIGNIEEGTVDDQDHSKFSVSCGTSYKKIKDDLFEMHVETTGCITAKEALLKSIEIIKNELINYKKMI